MQPYEIAITTCNSLSLLGSIVIISLFLYYKKLRQGLFSHIIIYITIGAIVLNVGIQLSNSSFSELCRYSTSMVIFGQILMILQNIFMMWSIRSIFIVYKQGGSLDELEKQHNHLRDVEKKALIFMFLFPFVMAIWPLLVGQEDYTQSDNAFCYIEISSSDNIGMKIQTNIEKLLIWEIPVCFYLLYCIKVALEIKSIFVEQDEGLYQEVQNLLRKLMLFPLATLICTIQFTIMDFETLFGADIGVLQATFGWSFLALWGFVNSICYLQQSSVKAELQNQKENEQELNQFIQDLESSNKSEEYFYFQPFETRAPPTMQKYQDHQSAY